MRKLHQGGMFVLALALAAPSFIATRAAVAKTAATSGADTAPAAMSKEDQDKLKEHNKLRAEIKKVKYPAPKARSSRTSRGSRPTTRSGSTRRCPTRRTARPTMSSRRSAGRPPRPPPSEHRLAAPVISARRPAAEPGGSALRSRRRAGGARVSGALLPVLPARLVAQERGPRAREAVVDPDRHPRRRSRASTGSRPRATRR